MIDWNDDNRLYVTGYIDKSDAELARDWLTLAGVRDRLVWAEFDSIGGNYWAALEIHDAFRRHGSVYGLVAGECSSGAVLAYSGCKHRVAKPGAKFMVHRCYNVDDGTRDETTRRHDNEMILRMAGSLGLDFSEVWGWFQGDRDRTFDADEALQMGLVDWITGQRSPARRKRQSQTAARGTKRDRIMAALQSVKGLPPLWNIDANMRTPAMARALSSFTRNGTQTVQGRV